MISTLRRRMTKTGIRVAVWFTIFSLAGVSFFMAIFRRFNRVPHFSVAEVVNGYDISQSDLRRKMNEESNRISMIRQQFGKNADIILKAYGMSDNPEEHARTALRQQKLMLGVADELGLELSPTHVGHKLTEPAFALQVMGDYVPSRLVSRSGLNYRDLLRVLQNQGVSASCFEAVAEERLKSQLVALIASGATYIPVAGLKDQYNRAYRGRTMTAFKLPIDSYLAKAAQAHVDDGALKKFYDEANQRNRYYYTHERRQGTSWDFAKVPDYFAAQAEQAALRGGAFFDEFVKKFKGTRSPLALMEFRPTDPVARKLFDLRQGQRGVVMDKDHGTIVQVDKIEPSVEQSFDSVKTQVRKDYDHAQAAEMLAGDLEKLKTMSDEQRNAWVKEHKAQVHNTAFITPSKQDDWKWFAAEGIPAQRLMGMTTVHEKMTIVLPRAGYLVELTALAPFDQKQFEEKQGELRQGLFAEERSRVVAGFIDSLEKNATIKTNKLSQTTK